MSDLYDCAYITGEIVDYSVWYTIKRGGETNYRVSMEQNGLGNS